MGAEGQDAHPIHWANQSGLPLASPDPTAGAPRGRCRASKDLSSSTFLEQCVPLISGAESWGFEQSSGSGLVRAIAVAREANPVLRGVSAVR